MIFMKLPGMPCSSRLFCLASLGAGILGINRVRLDWFVRHGTGKRTSGFAFFAASNFRGTFPGVLAASLKDSEPGHNSSLEIQDSVASFQGNPVSPGPSANAADVLTYPHYQSLCLCLMPVGFFRFTISVPVFFRIARCGSLAAWSV
jgi:hypothetical protein